MVDRCRARLIAHGFQQRLGVDYISTYSPVACSTIIRSLSSLIALRNLVFSTFDIETAFLNAALEERIYVEQPKGFQDGSKKAWLLEHFLGLKKLVQCGGLKTNWLTSSQRHRLLKCSEETSVS